MISSILELDLVATDVSQQAIALARAFWPGGLTLVLKKRSVVPDIVTGGLPTLGVRVPAHRVPLALIRKLGSPLVGTSANLSGTPSLTRAADVRAQFGRVGNSPLRVDYVFDGRCKVGVESTIVDVTGRVPRILRQGAVPRRDIERVCGKVA